jgi:hypothetical protein
VFKLENEDVWAVGWSDVHYKTYVTTHGCSSDGDPAQKKRQRLDGRNYKKDILRWKLVDESESSFFRFLRELLPTVADAAEAIEARQVRSKCSQNLIGKGTVKEGAKKGQEYAKQGRCHYCIKRKTKEDKEGSNRSRRTAYLQSTFAKKA